MSKIYYLFFNLFIFLTTTVTVSYGQFWNEYWQNYSYRETNYSDIKPKPREDFSILISVIKPGYRFYLHKADTKKAWRIGLDAYGRFEHVHDFMKDKYLHNNVYNLHYKFGFGAKVRFQMEHIINHWIRYIQFDLFSEWQRMETSIDALEIKISLIEQNNIRLGINGWTNSGIDFPVRHETYFDLSYHTTNFADPGKNPYLILTLSPRFIYNFSTLDFYLNEELVKDFLNDGDWNRNPFSNNLKTIIGLRKIFELQKLFNFNPDHFLGHASFLIFTEYSFIHYLDDVQDWPWQTELADHDFRAGFMIWWPLGESKYVPVIQNVF